VKSNKIEFEGRKESAFDAIVFATGYKSTANSWLKVAPLTFHRTLQIN
jgi:indole-3-pyruvate monooxygenase